MIHSTVKFIILISILTIGGISLESCEDDQCTVRDPEAVCGCPEIYAPVCGCNGVTYGNSCEAECVGVSSYSEGACQ